MTEIWKTIDGFNGWYDISNFGKIRSWRNNTNTRGVRKTPRILKHSSVRGYMIATLFKNKERYKIATHRLVAQAFIPNTDDKPHINHKDGVRYNNHISNLEWCTRSENMRHAHDNNMVNVQRGEDRPMAKLTENDVKEIRQIAKGRGRFYNPKELAEKYGVHYRHISRVVKGTRWGHVI